MIELINNNMRDYTTNFTSMVNSYNNTINGFNQNIENLLDLLIMSQRDLNFSRPNIVNDSYVNNDNTIHSAQRNYQNNRRTISNPLRQFPQTPIRNPLSRNDRYHTYLFTLPLNVRQNENNIDRLTNQQIENSTEVISYSSQISDIRCPISWEDFTIGERICQIKHCKHAFKTTPLMDWFSRNTSCPVCRYDLRNYRGETTNNERIEVSNNVLESINNNYETDNENDNEYYEQQESEPEEEPEPGLVTNDNGNELQHEEIYGEDMENENENENELTNDELLEQILDEVMRDIGNTLSNTVYDISNNQFELDVSIERQL